MKKNLIIYVILFVAGVFIGGAGIYFLSGNSSATTSKQSDNAQLYTCGMHPDIIEEEPGDCPICGMKLTPMKGSMGNSGEKKILYWRAPMDPNEIYDEPGKSKMGMDLVPVYESDAGASGIVTVDGAVTQTMNVKIEHIKLREISSEVYTNGILSTDERLEFVLNTKISGWVEKLYVNYTGQKISKGEKLVDIYSPELVAAQQELLTAVAYKNALSTSNDTDVFESGEQLVENAIRKLELLDISDGDIKKLMETKEVTKLMTIYAPFNGTVLVKNVVEGEKINAGRELLKIADLSRLWLKADIYENELNKIELGSTAEITFSYNPDKVYLGKVSFIYPTVDPKTRTVQVRIDVDNRRSELKPSMFGNVKIKGKNFGKLPSLPETAVIRSGKRDIVILALGEGRFKPVEVKIGQYSDGYYQVLSGVKEGDMIVTSSQFMIDSESSLRSAVQLFSSSDAAEHENMEMEKVEDVKANEMEDEHIQVEGEEMSIVRKGIIDVEAIDENGDGKVFQDPMDWNVISDEEGRCPLCNMFLKEVTIEEAKTNLKNKGFEYK